MDDTTRQKLINRLSRTEGQIRALKKALAAEETQDCAAFITQVKAARSALRRVSEQYVLAYLTTCEAMPREKRTRHMRDAINLLASE